MYQIKHFTRHALAALVGVLVVAGCARDTEAPSLEAFSDEAGVLGFVPADTHYLFTRLKPLPEAFMSRLEAQSRATSDYNQSMLDEIRSSAAKAEPAQREVIEKWTDFVSDMTDPEGETVAGLGDQAPFAVYGVDLVPVFRTELTDREQFDAALQQFIENAEMKTEVGRIDEEEYLYVQEDGFRLILLVQDEALVATIAASDLADEDLKSRLGLARPSANIAASGRLAELARDYGYQDFGMGFIEIERIGQRFMADDGVFDELSAMQDGENWRDKASDGCIADAQRFLSVVPRVVMGVRKAGEQGLETAMVVELREDIASGLQGLAAPVPGLGLPTEALFAMGFSFDASVARKFVDKRLAELAERPFQCETMQDANKRVTQSQEFLARQPVPDTVNDFSGFYLEVHEMDLDALTNRQIKGVAEATAVLELENPEGLTATASLFLPGFAELGLQPDGEVRAIPTGTFNPTGESLNVAMNKRRMIIGFGEGAEARMPALLDARPNPEAPLFAMDMAADQYFSFISDMMSAELPAADGELGTSAQGLLAAISDLYGRGRFTIDMHRKGVEISTEITFKE